MRPSNFLSRFLLLVRDFRLSADWAKQKGNEGGGGGGGRGGGGGSTFIFLFFHLFDFVCSSFVGVGFGSALKFNDLTMTLSSS